MSGVWPEHRRLGALSVLQGMALLGSQAKGAAVQSESFGLAWGEDERRHLVTPSNGGTRRPIGSDKKRKCTKAQRKKKRQQQKESRKRNR